MQTPTTPHATYFLTRLERRTKDELTLLKILIG